MSQKLGLAAAFLSECKLLILDEPMSGLDPVARVKLKENIKNYITDDKTIFFSSHVLSDLQELCTNILVINDKNKIYDGCANNFIQKYDCINLEQAFIKSISKPA
jgi:ABC-2 type transport system ATP-binding protein